MGEPKQLLKWGNRNLLGHAIEQAQLLSKDVFVVLGAHFNAISPTIIGVKKVHNKNWELGLGSSIAAGVSHIKNDGTFTHLLIMLADQPYLDAMYLRQMVAILAKKPNGIIATAYNKKAGVPAIFSSDFFDKLERLNQDYGARKLMQRYKEDLILVSPTASTLDIDTKQVYLKEKPDTT